MPLTCSICLGRIDTRRYYMCPSHCHHPFHENCLTPWIQHEQSCPYCRGRLDFLYHLKSDNGQVPERRIIIFIKDAIARLQRKKDRLPPPFTMKLRSSTRN